MHLLRRILLVIAFGALAAAMPARTAHAQVGSEHIVAFDVTMALRADGALAVNEAISYDFGVVPHHGIFRDLVVRETYDAHHDRRYTIEGLRVVGPNNSAIAVKTTHEGGYLHVRIGDPNRTVTGEHFYLISYVVRGAPLTFADHDELYWDAIGNQWPVSIARATILVRAPAPITKVACFAGPNRSSLPCDRATHKATTATFVQSDLNANEGVTIVLALPKGTIQPPPEPILERRRTLGEAFAVRPNTVGPPGVLALLAIGAVVLVVWRRGRDRRYTGSAVDAAMGNVTGEEEPQGLMPAPAGPVEFIPPDGIRPGQVGTLADEHANVLDVTATIVDLAVRGWLTITDISEGDYQLAATQNAGKGTLLPYETMLMNDLFASGPEVKLSDLKYEFRSELHAVQSALYDDVVTQGWYRTRPDRSRAIWLGIGLLVVLAGIGLTILTAWASSFGIVPLAIVLAGVALMACAGRIPSRTGKGSAMLSRVRGFRRLFDEGEQDTREHFAEQHGIFSEYLPYAIVFGCTKKWAKVFQGLDAEALGASGWYSGPNALDAFVLASAMDNFGTVATGTLYASMPSSSSSGFSGFSGGFSGGGGGGGGGGSW